jgi:hypothetical protein
MKKPPGLCVRAGRGACVPVCARASHGECVCHGGQELVQTPTTLNFIALFDERTYEAATPVKTVGPRQGAPTPENSGATTVLEVGLCFMKRFPLESEVQI